MTDETVLLTYDELAARLGIERESARQLVLRKRWARQKGNDGRARIEVPLDVLPADTSDTPLVDTPVEPSDDTGLGRILTRHIERLEQALDTANEKLEQAEIERDEARDESRAAERERDVVRSQLEGLQAVLETEKALRTAESQKVDEMVGELRADRDRWHRQAQELQERALKPWWRRLAG
ncbi:hypothetical protein [Consotaella aegiceratis]|uniref:hypothetical protein n=1 Tax=Consotaella aegiceratis TaxID=3097961 RepID=UPI002F3E5379